MVMRPLLMVTYLLTCAAEKSPRIQTIRSLEAKEIRGIPFRCKYMTIGTIDLMMVWYGQLTCTVRYIALNSVPLEGGC